MICRVCGSLDTTSLPIGKYEEFFRLRVDTSKDKFQLFSRADSIQIKLAPLYLRALRKAKRLLRPPQRRQPAPFRTQMQSCALCHGVTPCHEYSYEDLLGLYKDYRSETYNRDRIRVEPTYVRIVNQVGSHPLEIAGRNGAVDRFLSRNHAHFAGGTMIDYGGSDGRFIPSFAYQQFDQIDIYDASNAPLHTSVPAGKVKRVAAPHKGAYSFLTCMHVLEHVGNPRSLVAEVAELIAPGGLMYIEVPQELTQEIREGFLQRVIDTPIAIHEHMNRFDHTSMLSLLGSIPGLTIIDDAEDTVDLGWVSGLIGRFLARKAG
jgi:Methyltransferase domain